MGVPGLFGYCLKKFGKNIVIKQLKDNIDYLFIDGNGFIYNAVDKVLKEIKDVVIDKEALYYLIYNKTFDLITENIKEVKPKVLYLTFDGVAPMAKINQQRSRRYKTKYEDDYKASLKLKYNIKDNNYSNIWSNVLITPGTSFMDGLNNFFETKFKELNKSESITFIYNGSDVIGEGEHKILNFIKQNKDIINKNIVVHGLDGDLIFLLMLTDIKENKNNNIYILREIKTKENIIRSYLNINDLKSNFINEISSIVKKDNEQFIFTINNLVDFIFIFFFIGNDFLPCQRFIDIYGNGINDLINNYVKCVIKYNNIISILDNDINFNVLALFYFIQLCTVSEYEEFKRVKDNNNKDIYFRIDKLKKKYNNMSNGYDKDIYKFENNNLTITNYQNLNVSFDDYKFEYYNHFTNSIDNQKQIIDNICKEYLCMLKWNIEYYLFGCKDWLLYYPYKISPFFEDIQNFITTNNFIINNQKMNINNPVKSDIQLLLCIPKKYLKSYIPEVYKLINIRNGFMFPDNYTIDLTNQMQLHKSVILIPNINIDLIINLM